MRQKSKIGGKARLFLTVSLGVFLLAVGSWAAVSIILTKPVRSSLKTEVLHSAEEDVLNYLSEKYNQEFRVERIIHQSTGGKPLFDFDSPPDTTGEYYIVFDMNDNNGTNFGVHFKHTKYDGDEIVDLYRETEELTRLIPEIYAILDAKLGDLKNYSVTANEFVDHYLHGDFREIIDIFANQKMAQVVNETYIVSLISAQEDIFEKIDSAFLDKNATRSGRSYELTNPNNNGYSHLRIEPIVRVHFADKKQFSLSQDGVALQRDGHHSGGCMIRNYQQFKECKI